MINKDKNQSQKSNITSHFAAHFIEISQVIKQGDSLKESILDKDGK